MIIIIVLTTIVDKAKLVHRHHNSNVSTAVVIAVATLRHAAVLVVVVADYVMHCTHSYRLEGLRRGGKYSGGTEDMSVKLSFILQAKFCVVSSRRVSDDVRVGTHTQTWARDTSNVV